MANRSLHYCALAYLNQWLLQDAGHCHALASGSEPERLECLGTAASFYRIARNLPLAGDVHLGLPRYKPLLDILDSIKADDFKNNTVERIREVESAISEKYCDKGVLSLTTKMLWLKVKNPIIIYDSQARKAIGTKDGDLESYYPEWNARFQSVSAVIADACDQLPGLSKYTVDEQIATPEYIRKFVSRRWFRERVFDHYLWNAGRDD